MLAWEQPGSDIDISLASHDLRLSWPHLSRLLLRMPLEGAPLPDNESERLAELRRYDILDTPDEDGFDDLTRLATLICGAPIALVSLVDADRQWFKSRVGLDARETPRAVAFCAHAIKGREVFEVADATADERFRDNPLVTDAPNVRFYAGAPLIAASGHAMGTLCVIDRIARQLTAEQHEALTLLSREVVARMEMRLLNRRLQAATSFQQTIVDTSSDGIIATNPEGIITMFNRSAELMTGVGAKDVICKQTPMMFHDPVEVATHAAELSGALGRTISPDFDVFIALAAQSRSFTQEWACVRPGGSRVPVLLSCSALRFPDGTIVGYLILAREITERKKAEIALRNSDQRMRLATEGAGIGIWEWNVQTGTVWWDTRMFQIYGIAPTSDGLVDYSVWSTAVVAEDLPQQEAQLRDVIVQRGRGSRQFRIRRAVDGALRFLHAVETVRTDAQGEVECVVGTNIDVTERGQAEERFRLVVEGAPNAMLKIDCRRVIDLVNRRAEELFGYTREELIGQSIEVLIPERFRAAEPGHMAAFFVDPKARSMGGGREFYGLRKDGSEVPIEIGLSPIEMPDGLSTLASIVDITEHKRAEDNLRRSNAELEQFAYVASHDLQEPLRMVASYTGLLEQRYKGKLDAKADKYIHYAVDGAKRMQGLIRDLLDFSRVGSQGKPLAAVASKSVVRSVLEMLAHAIRDANAHVEITGLPTVLADEGQLRQLFQNLIGNALKFRGEAAPLIRIQAVRRKTHWLFSVTDNGIGMDMKYAERVFQMFQRLHSRDKYEGTGIGLAISKRIVERHGGQIWIESTLGSGTTFFFTLKPGSEKEAS